jgi:hypothetical protein
VIDAAWSSGARTADDFQAFLDPVLDGMRDNFVFYSRLMKDDSPPMQIGGNIEPLAVARFWKRTRKDWLNMFGKRDLIPSDEFKQKLARLVKMPHQTLKNARKAIKWLFATDRNEMIYFEQFCGFLGQFGPMTSAMRKVQDYFKCQDQRKDLESLEIAGMDQERLVGEVANLFTMETRGRNLAIYNRIDVKISEPHLVDSEPYLVDEDGRSYASWTEVFEANPK